MLNIHSTIPDSRLTRRPGQCLTFMLTSEELRDNTITALLDILRNTLTSPQEEAQLMARMETSGTTPPETIMEGAASKPAHVVKSQANGALAEKAPNGSAGQPAAHDTGQGEDLVTRLNQVVRRCSANDLCKKCQRYDQK